MLRLRFAAPRRTWLREMSEAQDGINNWPPRFSLDQEQILRMLTGERFYSSADAALREAALNSIDAIGRRRVTDAVDPELSIEFDDDRLTLTVADNGDGMNRERISSLFAKVGASASRLLDAKYPAVGEFGIGVVSYFLVGDNFDLHTVGVDSEPVAVRFSAAMLDGTTEAEVIPCERSSLGTTLVLWIRSQEVYNLLLEKLAHWCRQVEGLVARRLPAGHLLPQGKVPVSAAPVVVDLPEWIESADIGCALNIDSWGVREDVSGIVIMYRGVFVQHHAVPGLWGVTGTLNVDPKALKPKLNRESFIAQDLINEVDPFLVGIHPAVLLQALQRFREAISGGDTSEWTRRRMVTYWLAVPRGGAYVETAAAWDDEFRQLPAFVRLGVDDGEDYELSLAELAKMTGPVYVVPDNLSNATLTIRTAVRLLRGKRATLVRGIERDGGVLQHTSLLGSTTSVLLQQFESELPQLIPVEQIADELSTQESVICDLFASAPLVRLVRLGSDGAPVARVRQEAWINVECEIGRQLVLDLCEHNFGRTGLLARARELNVDGAAILVESLGRSTQEDHLGLVRREYLRRIVA